MKSTSFKPSKFTKVKKGAKVTTEIRPEIRLGNGYNKLILNGKGSAILGLKHEDYVEILVNDEADDINNMFGIAVSTKELGGMKVAQASKNTGKGQVVNFNYSGVYSQMLQATPGALPISKEALIEGGFMRVEQTQMNKAKTKMLSAARVCNVVSYEVGDTFTEETVALNEEGTETHTYKVYPLINVNIKPREVGAVDEELPSEE